MVSRGDLALLPESLQTPLRRPGRASLAGVPSDLPSDEKAGDPLPYPGLRQVVVDSAGHGGAVENRWQLG